MSTPTDSNAPERTATDSSNGRLSRLADGLQSHTGAATGVATFALIAVITGLLWAGTGVNNGLEAPHAVVIPTVWVAAVVGGLALTALFAFLAFLYYLPAEDESESSVPPPHGQAERGRGGDERAGDDDRQRGPEPSQTSPQPKTTGETVDVGGQGSPSGPTRAEDPTVEQRVDDNWPDAVSSDPLNDEPEE